MEKSERYTRWAGPVLASQQPGLCLVTSPQHGPLEHGGRQRLAGVHHHHRALDAHQQLQRPRGRDPGGQRRPAVNPRQRQRPPTAPAAVAAQSQARRCTGGYWVWEALQARLPKVGDAPEVPRPGQRRHAVPEDQRSLQALLCALGAQGQALGQALALQRVLVDLRRSGGEGRGQRVQKV